MKSWEDLGDFAAQIGSKILTKDKFRRPISQMDSWLYFFFKSVGITLFIDTNKQFGSFLDLSLNLLMIGLNFEAFLARNSLFLDGMETQKPWCLSASEPGAYPCSPICDTTILLTAPSCWLSCRRIHRVDECKG